MFPAIFAVVLLGHFVAAEIYVGQNPQNVNAVIKDENGNLIPVTGVADEIVVVDLNYGGEEKSSGMSVDVSVSPVNVSSISSTGYPASAYPSSISMPSESMPMQISNPPLSPSPVTLPSAAPLPPTWNFSSFAGPNQSSISSSLGSSNSKPGVSPSTSGAGVFPSNSGLGVGLNIPPFSSIGTSSIGAPVIQPPVIHPPVIHPPATGLPSQSPSKSNGSKNKKSNPPNFFNLFGGRAQKKTPKNNGFAAPSIFVELGGSLGPVVDPVTLTPVNTSDSFVSNVTPSSTHQKNNKNNSFFNMTNMMMNLSSPFQFPPNTNATPLNDILGTLFNGSTIKMQPVNESFPALSGLINSFLNNGQSKLNPRISSASPFNSFLNSFTSPSALFPQFGGSSPFSFTNLLNSFANSSAFNLSSTSPSFDDIMNSFFQNNPSLFNETDGSLSPLTDMMNSIMNTTSSLFNMSNGTTSFPLTDIMNSIMNPTSNNTNSLPSVNESPFSGLFGLFSPHSSPSISVSTPASSNSSGEIGFQNSISNLLNSFLGGNSSIFNSTSPSFMSGNSKNLKSMMQNFLPPSMLGGNDDDEYNMEYPEDEIYKDLNSNDNDDEDYFNPLPGLLPPRRPSDVPSSSTSVVNNPFTPLANGTTTLTNLLNGEFGVNGTKPPSTNLFSAGGLFNPATFMNNTSFNLTSAASNFKPFSSWQKIITSLNNTGLFGDLSGLSQLTKNLSSIITQAMNNSTQNNNLDQITSIIISMWKNIIPIFQKFMSIIAPQTPSLRPGQSLPIIPFPPAAPPPMPRGLGTSFLVVPSSPSIPMMSDPLLPTNDEMQASAPASEPKSEATPESKPETTPETTPESKAQPIPEPVDSSSPVPVPPQMSTSPKPETVQNSSIGDNPASTPANNTNDTVSPNAGINLSSTWITLISCSFVAFSRKNFLGLL